MEGYRLWEIKYGGNNHGSLILEVIVMTEAEQWLTDNDQLLTEEELKEYIERMNYYLKAEEVNKKVNEMNYKHNLANIDYSTDIEKAFNNLIITKKRLNEYYEEMKAKYNLTR